ncbi:universal stress protein [bacterium]|nr:universal stress protein [bacterium]MBP9809706.1 universal stress protein [bacterium]
MKILLAVDGSPCSKLAIDSIATRAWPTETLFKVITVLEPFHPELAGWHSGYVPLAIEAQQERLDEATTLVEETAERLWQCLKAEEKQLTADSKPVAIEVLEGNVKERIVECAREWHADMIVMGSHGRQGIEKLFLGSVSQAVLTEAPCSVEIVKRNSEK